MPAQLLKLLASATADVADAELLRRFVESRDEAAFAELLRRHGPAVYRICRRLTGPSADDAFQATFLVLVSRAQGVRKAGSVGSWLIGVAGRVSRQMRKRWRRSQVTEVRSQEDIADPSSLTSDSRLLTPEIAAALDDELTRLPDELRDAVVLCLVQGRPQEQAAAELGGSVRTLRRRLERAKALLRLRLERRGIVPTVAGGLVAGLAAEAPAVAPELARKTADEVFCFLAGGGASSPAAVVAKGVVGSMAKLNVPTVASAAVVLALGLGVGLADNQPVPSALPTAPLAAQPDRLPLPGTPDTPSTPLRKDAAVPTEHHSKPSHKTANFIVYAPTPTMARAIAAEAEYQRVKLATQLFGKELPGVNNPPMNRLCAIQYIPGSGETGGGNTFEYGKDKDGTQVLVRSEIELRGEFLEVLTDVLPREMVHVVMATHFRDTRPRWADAGLAMTTGSADVQTGHDVRCRELLNAGRGFRLKTLFRMTVFPEDVSVFYPQSHSVVRFLLTRPVTLGVPMLKDHPQLGKLFQTVANPHQQFIAFLHLGLDGNSAESWDKAAKTVYGFESVDALEEAWLEFLKKPESKPKPPPARPKDNEPDLIPPAKLPVVDKPPALRP